MNNILRAGSIITLLWLFAGCNFIRGNELQGTITSRKALPQGGFSIDVNGVIDGKDAGLYHFSVGPSMPVFDQRPGQSGSKQVSFTSLQVGQTVLVRITGNVQESHPAGVTASQVIIK